jgi:hypothetical protein
MELAKAKEQEKKQHCQQVYDAILSLQNKAKTMDIKQWIDSLTKLKNETLELEASRMSNNRYYLWTKKQRDDHIKKNWNYSLSERTIERCIQNDSRIVKNGWYYSVDEDVRFETRYLDPIGFGQKVYDETIGKQPFNANDINETTMSEMIQRFGFLIKLTLIAASRPFEDQYKSLRDRDELVEYWAKKAIPVDRMFNAFWIVFNMSLAKLRNIKPDWKNRSKNEMVQSQLDECLGMLERSYPELYKDLAGYKRKSPQNAI